MRSYFASNSCSSTCSWRARGVFPCCCARCLSLLLREDGLRMQIKAHIWKRDSTTGTYKCSIHAQVCQAINAIKGEVHQVLFCIAQGNSPAQVIHTQVPNFHF